MTTDTDNAGRQLRERRRAAGLTRADLAGLIGRSISALGSIEAGAVPHHSDVLVEAQAALDRVEDERGHRG